MFVPRGFAVATPFSFRDRTESSDKTERVAAELRGRLWVGSSRGSSPLYGAASQFFRAATALDEDRRRAGRWDREQLIGGKAIEPRK